MKITALVIASALSLGSALPAFSETDGVSVIEAADFSSLREKFCAADPEIDHIVIAPAALFVDSQQLICPAGPYKLYRVVAQGDAGDFEYFIDPPFGARRGLACDGKAGHTMQLIATNCRPVD